MQQPLSPPPRRSMSPDQPNPAEPITESPSTIIGRTGWALRTLLLCERIPQKSPINSRSFYFSPKYLSQRQESVRKAGEEVRSRDRTGGLAIKPVLQYPHESSSRRNVAGPAGRRSHFSRLVPKKQSRSRLVSYHILYLFSNLTPKTS